MKLRNKNNRSDFGKRLLYLRKKAGLTQCELGSLIGISKRNVAYYETQSNYPPAHILPELSKALSVSLNAIFGISRKNKIKKPTTKSSS
jgi:transcriptional regulator with XRE-family HTH domain